ncbi:YqgE/AlgH family protein [Algirhabdus cladophorae]|uniref:YqgE/AlgH family protein n=1 Tax=Algirhabdus cladophorae TaxID=3377108 RepID=UPI003B84A30E
MAESSHIPTNLTGKMLIAMPSMGDPRFAKSVVYMCAHSEEGAMGLIINKPTEDLQFTDLLEQLDIKPAPDAKDIKVHFGGPVEHGRGFVLHSPDYITHGSTLQVDDAVSMTATLDILEDIARGFGPAASMMALGYSGWGPGQLEGELADNGWLTCEGVPDIVFGAADRDKWTAALESMGINPLVLSAEGGSA